MMGNYTKAAMRETLSLKMCACGETEFYIK